MKVNWTVVGAALGFLTVALGAFAAHGLEGRLDAEQTEWWGTAVQYQGLHALALCVVGIAARGSRAAGWCFALGCLFFCGTLYAMALGGPRWLGAVTPVGGLLFLAGWLSLGLAAWRRDSRE